MRRSTIENLPSVSKDKKGWPWTEESSSIEHIKLDLPKISIVTPSYNQGHFLERTIRSVLLQNYTHLEYIIIDGGSTDDSIQIIKKYERWISFWISEKDNGQSDAINKGLKRVSGDIISWLNSDDFLSKDALNTIINLPLNFKSENIILSGTFNGIDASEAPVWTPATDNSFGKKNWSTDKLLRIWNGCLTQPSTFWSKEMQKQIGLLNESFYFTMDLEYWIRAYQSKTTFYYIDKILSTITYHNEAKTLTSEDKFYSDLIILANKYLSGSQKERYLKELNYQRYVIKKLQQANSILGEKIDTDYKLVISAIKYSPLSIIKNFRLYFAYFKNKVLHLTSK